MANTTNYNWETPDDTDLVKDGAAAIRTLGSAIDTTVFNNASAAIAKSIIDAKADLITATAADTPARLASSGVNGEVLTIDTSTATGLKWATPSSGGMTLISTTTLSGATVTLTSIPGTYKMLRAVIKGALHTGAGNNTMYLIVNSTNSIYATRATTANLDANALTTSDVIVFDSFQPAVAGNLGICDFYEYADTTVYKYMEGKSINSDSATTWSVTERRTGIRTTSAISSITFSLATGNFNGGSVLLYGVS